MAHEFEVLINEESTFSKEIKLPDNTVTLNASCRLKDAEIKAQKLEYKYKWVRASSPDKIIVEKNWYKAKILPEGTHEYTVIVECGPLTKENTAKIIVSPGRNCDTITKNSKQECQCNRYCKQPKEYLHISCTYI